jgi:hypothetical protein
MSAKNTEPAAEAAGLPFDGSKMVAAYKKVRPLLVAAAVFSPYVAAFVKFCDVIFATPEPLEAAHHVARAA